MGFEIDFLAVGEESKGGDAIAFRYGDLDYGRSKQVVVVIDGGFADSGEYLVTLIKKYYETDLIDYVVSSHWDQDHISGLKVVLEEMKIGYLLMHKSWEHSSRISNGFTGLKTSFASNEAVTKSIEQAANLEELAKKKGISVIEPFTGWETPDGAFRVIGPSLDYYEQNLIDMGHPSDKRALASILEEMKKRAVKLIPEDLHIETLRDNGETTPGNNNSVISLLQYDNKNLLFTADAGIPALEQAVSLLEREGFSPGDLNFVQIPHHGSRRNVGPSILDRILGSKGKNEFIGNAFVSAPKKNPDNKHPSKKVTNAFIRRGYMVDTTTGRNIRHCYNAPDRAEYSPLEPLPFYDEVEDES